MDKATLRKMNKAELVNQAMAYHVAVVNVTISNREQEKKHKEEIKSIIRVDEEDKAFREEAYNQSRSYQYVLELLQKVTMLETIAESDHKAIESLQDDIYGNAEVKRLIQENQQLRNKIVRMA